MTDMNERVQETVARLRRGGWDTGVSTEAADLLEDVATRLTELDAMIAAYQDGTVPDLTAVYMAGGMDRRDEIKALRKENARLHTAAGAAKALIADAHFLLVAVSHGALLTKRECESWLDRSDQIDDTLRALAQGEPK